MLVEIDIVINRNSSDTYSTKRRYLEYLNLQRSDLPWQRERDCKERQLNYVLKIGSILQHYVLAHVYTLLKR